MTTRIVFVGGLGVSSSLNIDVVDNTYTDFHAGLEATGIVSGFRDVTSTCLLTSHLSETVVFKLFERTICRVSDFGLVTICVVFVGLLNPV